MKNGRIIICGAAGSGKDFLRKKFCRGGFSYAPPRTTRSKRKGEKDGKDYFFLTNEQFEDLETLDYFYISGGFNDWRYGIAREDFDNPGKIFIMSPLWISKIEPQHRKNSTVIYLDIDWETRYRRLKERQDHSDSIERRMLADQYDFEDFKDYDIRITNPDF